MLLSQFSDVYLGSWTTQKFICVQKKERKSEEKRKKPKEKEKRKKKKYLCRVHAAYSFAPPIHLSPSFYMVIFICLLCFKKVGCAHRASCVMFHSVWKSKHQNCFPSCWLPRKLIHPSLLFPFLPSSIFPFFISSFNLLGRQSLTCSKVSATILLNVSR